MTNLTSRKYKVGGHVFSLVLEDPWHEMEYTPAVAERIRIASEGTMPLSVPPVRAGDDVPARTLVTGRHEFPEGMDSRTLDLSQYAPFATDEDAPAAFTLTLHNEETPELQALMADRDRLSLILREDDMLPYYSIYKDEGRLVFEFEPAEGKIHGTLVVSEDFRSGEYFPKPGVGPYSTVMQLTTSLMVMYTAVFSTQSTLLMHASVVRHKGLANLFLGKSGTGKSTHSRLWLENVEGCDQINDDNPVLRFADDGSLHVYGTPWSGKTPCYRNTDVQVRAIVRLEQAPHNRISRLKGLAAYAAVLPSASSIKWDRTMQEGVSSTIEKIAMTVPVWHLDCLPDADAAFTCLKGVEG